MIDSDERALLQELCERASKEYNPEKLIELVRRINELLDKTVDKTARNSDGNDGQKMNSADSHFAGHGAIMRTRLAIGVALIRSSRSRPSRRQPRS